MDFREYLEQLGDGSRRLEVAGLQRLSQLSEEQQQQLSEAWPGIDVRRRQRLVQELVDLAEDNAELNFDAVFLRGLEDEDADVRLESLRGLWEHESPLLIGRLADLLQNDEDPAVRAEAALALGRYVLLFELGRLRERYFRQAEEALRLVLSAEGETEEVRARAVEAIGAHDAPWVRQAIQNAYENGTRRLKASAVHAMGRSAEPRWLPLLEKELTNDEAEIRYEAATAVGSVGEEESVPHLLALLTDPDEEVREATALALGEIGGKVAKHALGELMDSSSQAMREAAKAALNRLEFEEDPLGFKFRS